MAIGNFLEQLPENYQPSGRLGQYPLDELTENRKERWAKNTYSDENS